MSLLGGAKLASLFFLVVPSAVLGTFWVCGYWNLEQEKKGTGNGIINPRGGARARAEVGLAGGRRSCNTPRP